jgi:hypothetical protein
MRPHVPPYVMPSLVPASVPTVRPPPLRTARTLSSGRALRPVFLALALANAARVPIRGSGHFLSKRQVVRSQSRIVLSPWYRSPPRLGASERQAGACARSARSVRFHGWTCVLLRVPDLDHSCSAVAVAFGLPRMSDCERRSSRSPAMTGWFLEPRLLGSVLKARQPGLAWTRRGKSSLPKRQVRRRL